MSCVVIFEKSAAGESAPCSMIFWTSFPAFLFFYLAIREKKKYFYNNSLTWPQGFLSGIIISFIIALLNPAVQYVIYKGITPHFFENIIAYKVQHKMTLKNAQIYFNLKTYMIESTFTALSKGMI